MTIQKPIRSDNNNSHVLRVERPYYEQQQQFNTELSYCRPENGRKCSEWINNVKPLKFICSIFPIFSWLSRYSLKDDLIGDIISGCTVAVMHIPQGKENCINISYFDVPNNK